MKLLTLLTLILFLASSCNRAPLVSKEDMSFLEDITRAVVDSSRIFPGQDLPPAIRSFGPNRSGITLIKPGGRDCYPSFWIRDYAMSLESGLITPKEQLDILLYTAARQSDSTWRTKTGSMVPIGSIPDHIRINDGLPVYFPGTYVYEDQGNEIWRQPPFCDEFYFIHMAWYYLKSIDDKGLLIQAVNNISLYKRLAMAFDEVPFKPDHQMAFISDSLPTCDFGFRDVVSMTGEVCFGSLLRYRAALEMAEISGWMAQASEKNAGLNNTVDYRKNAAGYRSVAYKIKLYLTETFAEERGLLRASTGRSKQPDVWATAFAIYIGALDGSKANRASVELSKAYRAGTMAMEGQIRHILTSDDYSASTAWEKALASKNSYQNGAYWGTATGWVCYAMARTDRDAARQLAAEFIAHLRKTDFRLPGPNHGGPYECIYPPTGYTQNPVYMTSVTGPLGIFRNL